VSASPVEHKIAKRQLPMGLGVGLPMNVGGFGGQLGFGG